LVEALKWKGLEVVSLREPGGTAISEKIRGLLLDPANGEMADECELLLYEASRAQLVRQVIEPSLARGAIVVCDRFFDSTYGYQHGGRGLDESLVNTCNALGSCGLRPDVTVIFDLAPEVALSRATKGGADRLEGEGLAFQRRIREAYQRLAERETARVRMVDADGSMDEVYARLVACLSDVLPSLRDGEGN
jgi:dTMP kinase